jgi:hypothetical protein
MVKKDDRLTLLWRGQRERESIIQIKEHDGIDLEVM